MAFDLCLGSICHYIHISMAYGKDDLYRCLGPLLRCEVLQLHGWSERYPKAMGLGVFPARGSHENTIFKTAPSRGKTEELRKYVWILYYCLCLKLNLSCAPLIKSLYLSSRCICGRVDVLIDPLDNLLSC